MIICFIFFGLFLQYYVVITTCPNCSSFDPIRTKINGTSLSQNLSCGQTYIFTVTAVTQLEASAPIQIYVTLRPVAIGPVANLTVKYFPGKLSDVVSDESFDRFLLTWDPPKNLPDRIEV